MKALLCLAAFSVLMTVAFASGKGISIAIPLPFIKIRFVDIANLFGHHGDHGEGFHGGFGGHGGGFGLSIGGGHGGHGGHGW